MSQSVRFNRFLRRSIIILSLWLIDRGLSESTRYFRQSKWCFHTTDDRNESSYDIYAFNNFDSLGKSQKFVLSCSMDLNLFVLLGKQTSIKTKTESQCIHYIAIQCSTLQCNRRNINRTRSLGALRAPTSSQRPFGPLDFVLRALRALRPCDPRQGNHNTG